MSSGADRPEAGHHVFSWVRTLGVHRPDDAWVGGVCAAAAEKLRWDTALVRGIAVVAFLIFFSPVALFYGLAWLFLPNREGEIHAQQALRGSFPIGFWGAGAMTLVGAVNVFTPNIVGPFAILLNLVVISLVAWLVWTIFRSYQRSAADRAASPDGGAPTEESADVAPRPTRAPRKDGKPAWYPKEGPPPAADPSAASANGADTMGQGESSLDRSSPARADHTMLSAAGAQKTARKTPENPRIAEENRRRRMVTFGLVLLAVPAIAGAMWFATVVGLAATSAVLLGLALVVVLLALLHLGAAIRGKRGRAGLLGTFTVLMMVVFFFAPENLQNSSNHVLGNYTTQAETVNTAFANTTVDLRHLGEDLRAGDGETAGPAPAVDTAVELNNAFAHTTLILPDDLFWELDPGNFLGNIDIRTQHERQTQQGLGGSPQSYGPESAAGPVEVRVSNAFGNVVIYDQATYAQEELGDSDEEAS
ncbi:PspC domain-containing protein [Nesterenkonia sphaerica]|uniref:PspC domain-containing protein n=1 Tax=Nesterenkonia sphaerica TaxID=1804988 RepID=A0A5R9AER9_9MICC|nr:PspC domain-containing protein [Nesterenkonia sphaerica]TLP77113.1 PspC domain-containing protein [Nesterenkonia sphaerica]